MTGFDFFDAERGIFGTMRAEGGAVLFDHEDVVAASAGATPSIDEQADPLTAALDLEGASLRLGLSRLGDPLTLEGERSGTERLTVCQAVGELRRSGHADSLSCLGLISEVDPALDPSEVSLARSIAVVFGDGGLLALRAARPAGANGHGEEEVVAALAAPGGEVTAVREPLLSTQYDAQGRQVRATLELWPDTGPEPSPPLRAAGSIVCGTSLALAGRRTDIAIFRWSMEGRPGLGRYEVLSNRDQ